MEEVVNEDATYKDLEQQVLALEEENVELQRILKNDGNGMSGEPVFFNDGDFYRTIFEHAGFGIHLADLRTGKMVAFNRRAHEDLGYTREEYGQIDSRILIADPPDFFRKNMDILIRKGRHVHESKIITKDGEVRDFLFSVVVINIEGKKYAYGIRADITEQKRAERQLRENEEKYRNILENIEETYYETNRDGTIIFCNSAMCRHLGYTHDELIGMNTINIVPREDIQKMLQIYLRVLQTGMPEKAFDMTVVTKDGSRRIVEISASLLRDAGGNPVGYRGISRDVTEQKMAESALKESEAKYRKILETMEEGYYEIDRNGRFLFVNDTLCEIHGYSHDEIMNIDFSQYTLPEEAERLNGIYRQIWRTGKPENILNRTIIRKDGSRRLIETSASLLFDSAGERIGFRGITRDVTEKKEAEIALRKSEEKYRNILENMEEGYRELDLSGNLTYFNDAMCRIYGYSREELLGMNNREYVVPEQEKTAFQYFNEIYRRGKPARFADARIIRKDGAVRTIETSAALMKNDAGAAIGFRGMVRDITEQKAQEAALKESEEKYRVVVENASDGIFITQDGVIKFPNPKTIRDIGYTAEELANTPFINLIHPEDRKRIIERQQKRENGEIVQNNRTFRVVNQSGDILWVESSVIPIEWEGRPAFLNMLRDVTIQRQMEERIEQANKMEAIGTLAGGIAHDFNNLLMGIQGTTSLMLLDIDFHHPHFERLRNVERLVQGGADLTKQLLGVAKGGKYEVKPTDLNILLKESAEMFGRTRKEINIHMKFQEDIWTVDIDRRQIDQVLLNLNVNAWHAMPGGGDLYLETKNVVLDEYYTRPYDVPPGRYVRVSVTDSGVGMDDATLKRVFDPFFTTKEMGRGTGLGLASAYGIIKNHNGIINAYSEKGEGSSFNIYLPESDKAIALKSEARSELIQGTETILFIDDEETIIEIGEQILLRLGYSVIAAKSGKDALGIYQSRGEDIDLVILDMIMPGMNGGLVFDQLKKMNPDIRVLLSSGYSINGQAQKIIDRGCRGFIQKPFNITELSKKLRDIFDNG